VTARTPAAVAEPLLMDVQADTRERLLRVAMRLFAAYGVDRVSLKNISDAAGNKNKSAVGYHFDNKQGLINAVLERLYSDLAPKIDAVLSLYEAKLRARDEILFDEVVLELLTPILHLFAATSYGPDAVRVLARIMHDPLDDVPERLRSAAGLRTRRTTLLLHRLLPRKKISDVEHHVHHAVMATVNGLALQQRFVATTKSLWSEAPIADIFLSYVGYVVAGLSSGALNVRPGVTAAWRARLQRSELTAVGEPGKISKKRRVAHGDAS